ncbi:hypothetical protein GGI21_001096 [Coemansia aciculifera]|nr:hypothetical protein GGI21_001096 [Coemansia aciculifera]
MVSETHNDSAIHTTAKDSLSSNDTTLSDSASIDTSLEFSTYTRYAVVASCFVIQALSSGFLVSWGVQQEYLAANIYNGKPEKIKMVSYIVTIMLFSLFLWGMLAGWLAEVWSYRKLCFVGIVIMALGQLLASFCKEPWQLCLTEGVIFGLGTGLVFSPTSTAPARWFTQRRGLATGVAVAGSGVGGLIIAPLTEFLVRQTSIEWSLRISAIYIMVLGTIACYFVRVPFQDKTRTLRNFDWRAFSDRRFAANAGIMFFVAAAYIIPYSFLPKFWVSKGMSSQTASVLIAVANVSSLVSRLVIGFSADYIGVLNALVLNLLGASLSCLVLWPFATGVGMGVVTSIFYGFSSGGFWALAPLVAAKLCGVDRLASVSGVISTVAAVGVWMGSPVADAMLGEPHHSSYFVAVSTYTGVLWLAAFFLALFSRTLYSKKVLSKV